MSLATAAKASPSAVPRAPAPKSRNSADVVPYGVLSGLASVPCAASPAGASASKPVTARPNVETRLMCPISWRGAAAPACRPMRGLLREVHHGKPTDPACITGLDVVEVHPTRDHLIVAVPHVPGFLAAADRDR